MPHRLSTGSDCYEPNSWQFFAALVALTIAYLVLVEVTKMVFYSEPMRLAGAPHPTRGHEHGIHRRAARFSHPGRLPTPVLAAQ